MIKLQIKTEEGVFVPTYENELNSGFDLRAKSFKKLFKGNKEISFNDKLSKSISEGYLTLRGFERVLIGTGLTVMEMPIGYEIQLRSTSKNALKKGLLTTGNIHAGHKGEISVILINNTPFLSKITLGDVVAHGVVSRIQHALFWKG